MKKITFILIIAALAIGTASAQPWGTPRDLRGEIPQPTSIEGTLQLHNGHIAVAAENGIVYVPGLRRYVGFIEGIKEGERISVSGYAQGNTMHLTQFTISGKTHELTQAPSQGQRYSPAPGPNQGGRQNYGHHGSYGRGPHRQNYASCCHDYRGNPRGGRW